MFAAVLSLMRAQVFGGCKRGKPCREPRAGIPWSTLREGLNYPPFAQVLEDPVDESIGGCAPTVERERRVRVIMASSVYLGLLKIVSGYVNETKAREVIGRQIAKCGATPETLDAESLKKIVHMVAGAAGLYVADPSRRTDLAKKIAALAGTEKPSPL